MKNQTKNLVLIAFFIAIELLLFMVPFLGFIPLGPLRATTMHIPVIIAGFTLGKKEGMLLGFVFGLLSLIMNTINPTLTSFVFSPFISGSFFSLLIVFIPRILLGYFAYLFAYCLPFNQKINQLISGFLSTFIHTCLVLGGIYLLFGNHYASNLSINIHALLPYFVSIIFTNGLFEAISGSVIATSVSTILLKLKK